MMKKKANKRIRIGDNVIVITGNDRGKSGKVLMHFKGEKVKGEKVIVQGINVRKKAVRRTENSPQGGMVDREMPVHVSNVKLLGDEGKGVKVKVRSGSKGKRELFYMSGKKQVVYRSVK